MEAENREPDEGTKPGTKKSLIVLTVVIALIVAALTIYLPNLASVAVNGVSQTNTTPSLGTTDSSSSSSTTTASAGSPVASPVIQNGTANVSYPHPIRPWLLTPLPSSIRTGKSSA